MNSKMKRRVQSKSAWAHVICPSSHQVCCRNDNKQP
jgi:hypothetical protein